VKTSKKQIKEFCDEFHRVCRALGLMDWRVDFGMAQLSDRYATITIDTQSRTVLLQLADDIDNDCDVRRCARHEALHLMLADFRNAAESRTGVDMDAIEHSVVRRLERFGFEE